jgi:hypothetical protein
MSVDVQPEIRRCVSAGQFPVNYIVFTVPLHVKGAGGLECMEIYIWGVSQ